MESYADEVQIELMAPGGQQIGPFRQIQRAQRFVLGSTELLLYYGEPSPYSAYQEIYLDFLPVGQFIDSGLWTVRLIPQKIVTGLLQHVASVGRRSQSGNRFPASCLRDNADRSVFCGESITVGAYDARYGRAANFSGRGYTRVTDQVKPDLVAPGVEITSCAPGGGYQTRSGTSMATPFVSGAAALLMQWGITDGNDPYLYGEKMRAYLIRGAGKLPGVAEYPNPVMGGEHYVCPIVYYESILGLLKKIKL